MRRRDVLVAGLAAVLASAVFAMPAFSVLDGWSLDTLFLLRFAAFGARHAAQSSPTVVVALDEETWRSDDFRELPEALWPPKIGTVLTQLIAGGAEVVGVDVIYTTAIVGVDPEAQRQYRIALAAAARAGKIVLSKVQNQVLPIAPSREQSIAVGNERNIRAVNLPGDPDDIIRRVPVSFVADNVGGGTRLDPSLAVELAARAAGAPLHLEEGRPLRLGDYFVPGSESDEMLLNFDAGNDIPTYSLVDLYRCALKGDDGYFRDHFAGKVVLIGVVRDVEDRKMTAKRFITMSGGEYFASTERCATTPRTDLVRADLRRAEIPGVYIHATAVNNLLRREVLHVVPAAWLWAPSLALALAAAAGAMLLGPIAAGLALVLAMAAWASAATAALQQGWSLPLFQPILAALLALILLTAYRFAIADRDKRFLRRSFALYLAPAIVDRMIAAERPPDLGGEQRNLTVFFSDIADFTTLSETLSPRELVALMNAYLSAMTDIVEAHGGFVDKYIGDAILAVFGAPHDDPEHAIHAVETALECVRRLAALNADGQSFLGRRLAMRIGINTGEALVGNIGSRRRFNYTVMGDAVNLASRLQDLNKRYGTTILVSETTAAAVGGARTFRRVDRVAVKGRHAEVEVFTPSDDAASAAIPQPVT
jgi:adenylate cyclase